MKWLKDYYRWKSLKNRIYRQIPIACQHTLTRIRIHANENSKRRNTMPHHFHPILRALEEALETETLIKTLDSAGVTRIKADEQAGRRLVKIVPKEFLWIRGSKYTPA